MAAHETGEPSGYGDELVVTILQAALSRPETERAAFLREACADAPALLAEVDRRVRWEAKLGGFLLTPALPRERFDRPFAAGEAVLDARFAILGIAGEGGMGVVYEAFDRKLGQRVALKCPRFEFRKRLPPEAMKALSVAHPNVCKVYGFHTEKGDTGETDFFTMEFVEGETLAARRERAPARWLETEEGRLIAQQLCAGLEAVHAQGIVHRDLKASNVMLGKLPDGAVRAVIMDFGLAQGADLFSSSVRGTPAYLAPELWKGRPATVQSDLFALGVLLYEMACGRPPFAEGVSWETRLRAAPPPPETREPARSAIARCLDPDPARRFDGAADLRSALWRPSRRWIAGVAAAGAAGFAAKLVFWPTSAVRLAVLPPKLTGAAGASKPLIEGFLHDLSYRFKTLRGARRPLTVYSLAQEGGGADATHAIATEFVLAGSGWAVSAALHDASGRPLRQWRRAVEKAGLAVQLFALQSAILTESVAELSLRAESRPQTLPAAAHADYWQGLHFARFDYENAAAAIPLFEKVIAAAPASALGYAGLAEALLNARYMNTRDRSLDGRALEAIARAEQREPDSAHVQLMAGRLAAAGGSYERALASYRRAAELDPRDAEPHMEMARSYGFLNRLPEAEAAFHSAFALQPAYYKPYLLAGGYYYELGNYPAAEKHWLQAVRLAPDQTRARLNLGSLYLTQGRDADAEEQIAASLNIKKTRGSLELLAALLERAGRKAECVAALEEAIRLGPNYYPVWMDLGKAYERAARAEDARRTFRKGLEESEWGLAENPRDAYRIAWAAYYHAKLGEASLVRDRAQQALAIANPSAKSVRRYLTLAFDAIHDTEAALNLLKGAPIELVKDLVRNNELSLALRRDPRFLQLTSPPER